MDGTDLPHLPVSELSRLIRAREVSPVELTEAYLERIERIDPKLGSYVTVARDEAMQAARRAEAEIGRGCYLGDMHGVPVAVKDQMWARDIRTTNGSRLLKGFVPDEDATVIARLRDAGAVLLGKLNMAEFAAGGRLEHPYGVARNPWNLEYEPGISSSGSGAATAAALCATSLGEDTSGSIRFPSSWSGVVGLRPTWGRVSRYGLLPVNWSMDAIGPMSRTVEDCAITLTPICGYDPKDPYTQDAPVPDYRKALTGNIKGLRVGLVTEMTHDKLVVPEVREAVLNATALLERLGAVVDEVSIPLDSHGRLICYTLMYVETTAAYQVWVRDRLAEFIYDAQVKFLTGSLISAQHYYKALKVRDLLRRQTLEALERFDVLVSPTMRAPAQKVQPHPMPASKEEIVDFLGKAPNQTSTASLAGIPALSVPCGFTSGENGGLPIGLQIMGRSFGEAAVLDVAYAYEQNTPWHTRKPPI